MAQYESIVIGGGVIGTSIAYHLARLGQRRVLLLDRGRIGEGTTAQSSCILRTHYTVPENVRLAQAAWRVYEDFAGYLDDPEADCGLTRCGYLIAAPPGEKSEALATALAAQRGYGIRAEVVDSRAARALLPFEGGAQGEHKLARGFLPVLTRSWHWLADDRFGQAVNDFLRREGRAVDEYVSELEGLYKRGTPA